MASNAQKTPFAQSLNQFAARKVQDAIRTLGRALPCTVVSAAGSIVTVKFAVTGFGPLNNVTMPAAFPEYIRVPFQPGDPGMTVPSDLYLGGVSGLGGGVAGPSLPANLSALLFVPVASKLFSDTDDPQALVLYGPDGVVIRDANKLSVITVTPTSIRIKSASIILDGPVIFESTVDGAGGVVNFGTAAVHAGPILSNGVNVGSTHEHSGVQTGGGTSGPPV